MQNCGSSDFFMLLPLVNINSLDYGVCNLVLAQLDELQQQKWGAITKTNKNI
jgi:hypothetical protein